MQLQGIDTNLIIALHALLTAQRVTRAGKPVGLSPSSMSHALARLRAHFDDPLREDWAADRPLPIDLPSNRNGGVLHDVLDVAGQKG